MNLCEILKGHEEEEFYTSVWGNVTFIGSPNNSNSSSQPTIRICLSNGSARDLTATGHIYWSDTFGNIIIWPSKEYFEKYPLDAKKAWDEWIGKQKTKVPKTWSEYIKIVPSKTNNDYKDYPFAIQNSVFKRKGITPIEKSAFAFLKIHQLIEVGYGGNVTSKEWENNDLKYIITCNSSLTVKAACFDKYLIAFHSEKQAEEFLSYPENVQLLKEYFMVNN